MIDYSVTDTTGDADFPQGDITRAGFGQNKQRFAFGVDVVDPVDPNTDPIWQTGGAGIVWGIDKNSDGFPEDVAVFFGTGRHGALIIGFTSDSACDGDGAFVAGHGYRVDFKQGCPNDVRGFRWQAEMYYTDNPDQMFPNFDTAPNGSKWSLQTNLIGNHHGGYWMLGADGSVYAFGNAPNSARARSPMATAMAFAADGSGYWIVDAHGQRRTRSAPCTAGGHPALHAASASARSPRRPAGNGYWLFTNRGRAFPYGDAHSYGDMSQHALNGPIVASVATPTGHGYYMVGSDGGVFSFGDAALPRLDGRLAPQPADRRHLADARQPRLLARRLRRRRLRLQAHRSAARWADARLNRPVNGLVAYGNGYLMVGNRRRRSSTSPNKAVLGSLAAHPLSAPIVGLAAFVK